MIAKNKRKLFLTHSSTFFSLFLFGFVDVFENSEMEFSRIHSLDFASQSRIHSLWESSMFLNNCDGQFPLSLVPSPCEFRGFVDKDNSRLGTPQFEMEPAKNKCLW